MGIVTEAFGGDGGNPFDIQAINEIGVRSGSRIDALILNGHRYGGRGGHERERLTLSNGEYISEMSVRAGSRIDKLEFKTNLGRNFSQGGGGGKQYVLKNIRVLGLGGRSGSALDKLRIHYIKDYDPSVPEPGRHIAILGIVPPGEKTETFVSSRVSRLNSTRRVFETVFSAEVSTSSGEFIAMTNATFGFSQTITSEFIKQLETEEIRSKTVTRSPQAGFVGLETVQVEVYHSNNNRDNDGFWMFPVGTPEYIEVREENGLEGVIDLTGVLDKQLPVMAGRRVTKFGHTFYEKKA